MSSVTNLTKNAAKCSILTILLILLVVVILIWYLKFRWSRRHLYRLAAKIPHVDCWNIPFFGIPHIFFGNPNDILKKGIKLCAKNTCTKAWIGPKIMCIVYKPEDLQIILNSRKALGKHELVSTLRMCLGDGLVTARVPQWKVHRKIIQPTFNKSILNRYVDIFSAQANILVKMLRNDVGEYFDISQRLSKYAMDSVCESVMGVKMNAQTSDCLVVRCFGSVMEASTIRFVIIAYQINFIFRLTKWYKNGIAASKCIHDYVDNIIQKKYKINEQNKYMKEEYVNIEETKYKPFLDLLIELKDSGAKFTDKDLRDETNTILVAGTDTSKTTVAFVLMILGMFPDIQQKCYDEFIDVIGLNRDIVDTDLPNLKYIEMVIKETLRIFPLAPVFFRRLHEDLKLTTHTLPKGAGLAIAVISVQRSPDYWEDPLKFDPNRFLPEEVAKRHPYTYLPFSAGPRNCLGYQYAMMSMKTVIPTILREYIIESPYKCIEDIDCTTTLFIKPINGYQVKLIPRNKINS